MKTVRMIKSGRLKVLTDRQAANPLWKKITREEPLVVKKPRPATSVFDQIVDAAREVGELGRESKSKRRRYRRRDMEAEDCSTSSANS